MSTWTRGKPVGELVATYVYTDEVGKALYRVERFEPKNFRPRLCDRFGHDGKPVWAPTFGLGTERRVLYHLPELRAAIAAGVDPIFFCEGEKDVHAVEALGGVATTMSGGVPGWRPELVAMLYGAKRVCVIADKDAPGLAHAHRVADSLRAIGVRAEVAQPKAGKDFSDAVAATKVAA